MKSILTSVLVLLISSLGLSQSVTTAFETGAGNCDGQAFLVDSTNALTTWNWVDQDTITVLQVDGDTLSNICSGNYFLIYNAGADTLTYSVSEDPCSNFSIFVAHLSQSIPGSCDGQAGVLLYGGVAPFTYQWNAAGNYETVQNLWDLCSDWYAVTVTDSIGCSILDSVFVDVDTNFSSCSAYFYHSLNSNGEMEFYSYASAGSTYSWDFGDGNTSTLPNPVHEYATVGTYQVNLFLTTPDGCTQGISKGVNASPPTSCDAYFISINDSIDQSLIYLVNLSSGMDTVQYSWDMGDGAVYSTETPSHSYSGSGPYNVCLTITDGDSCVNTHCRNVESFTKAGDFTVLVVEPGNTAPQFASVSDFESNQNVIVFPNPVQNVLNVSANEKAIQSIEIINALGATVVRKLVNSNNATVDVSECSKGIYLLNVLLENNETQVSKIIIE